MKLRWRKNVKKKFLVNFWFWSIRFLSLKKKEKEKNEQLLSQPTCFYLLRLKYNTIFHLASYKGNGTRSNTRSLSGHFPTTPVMTVFLGDPMMKMSGDSRQPVHRHHFSIRLWPPLSSPIKSRDNSLVHYTTTSSRSYIILDNLISDHFYVWFLLSVNSLEYVKAISLKICTLYYKVFKVFLNCQTIFDT